MANNFHYGPTDPARSSFLFMTPGMTFDEFVKFIRTKFNSSSRQTQVLETLEYLRIDNSLKHEEDALSTLITMI